MVRVLTELIGQFNAYSPELLLGLGKQTVGQFSIFFPLAGTKFALFGCTYSPAALSFPLLTVHVLLVSLDPDMSVFDCQASHIHTGSFSGTGHGD